MNLGHSLLWSSISTAVLTTLLSASRGMGFTRMDLSFMLGTLFTPNRDKAMWVGFLLHFLNGWILSLIYIYLFITTQLFHWWFGMAIGLLHSLFILTVVMNLLPFIHPRMATELRGPDPTRQLEPPGFMALNYGPRTPIITVLAHLLYGGILGLFY